MKGGAFVFVIAGATRKRHTRLALKKETAKGRFMRALRAIKEWGWP